MFACNSKSSDEKKPTGYYKVKNDTTLSFISLKNPKYNNDIKVIVMRDNQRISLKDLCLGEDKKLDKVDSITYNVVDRYSNLFSDSYLFDTQRYHRNDTQSFRRDTTFFSEYIEFDGLRDSLNPNVREVLTIEHDSVEIKLISGGKLFKRYVSDSGYDIYKEILSFTSIDGEKVNWKGDALFNILSKGERYYERIHVKKIISSDTVMVNAKHPDGSTTTGTRVLRILK